MEEEIKAEGAEQETEKPNQETTEEKPLDKLTAPELREIAKGIPGVSGVHALKKLELLSVIKKHRGIKDEEAGKKPELDTKSLKQKISLLRKSKEEARETKDKKKLNIYRRRINRMKKKTRKAARAA